MRDNVGNSKLASTRGRDGGLERSLVFESLETRCLLASDMAAAAQMFAMDVNVDGAVTPIDAMWIVNHLNASAAGLASAAVRTLDVNGDGKVSSNDFLQVANQLNHHGPGRIEFAQLLGDRASHLTQPQQSALHQAIGHLNSLRATSRVTVAQLESLVTTLSGLSENATAPSAAAVTQLFEHFDVASRDGDLSLFDYLQLYGDVNNVLRSANFTTSQVQQTVSAITSLLADSGIQLADIRALLNNLRAILQSS